MNELSLEGICLKTIKAILYKSITNNMANEEKNITLYLNSEERYPAVIQ